MKFVDLRNDRFVKLRLPTKAIFGIQPRFGTVLQFSFEVSSFQFQSRDSRLNPSTIDSLVPRSFLACFFKQFREIAHLKGIRNESKCSESFLNSEASGKLI